MINKQRVLTTKSIWRTSESTWGTIKHTIAFYNTNSKVGCHGAMLIQGRLFRPTENSFDVNFILFVNIYL